MIQLSQLFGGLMGALVLSSPALSRAQSDATTTESTATTTATLDVAADAVVEPAPQTTPPPDRAPLAPLGFRAPQKIIGIAEVGLGWLTFPSATLCGSNGCSDGDTSPLVEIWNLVRFDWGIAVGAGLSLGLIPTTSTDAISTPAVERNHRRSYLGVEGVVRYYPITSDDFEFWLGPGLGLVVVSDSFVPAEGSQEVSLVGTPGITLRSEGLSLFGGLGGQYVLGENWAIGAGARAGVWQLPNEPSRSPMGDEASLRGTNFFFSAGLTVALRAEL